MIINNPLGWTLVSLQSTKYYNVIYNIDNVLYGSMLETEAVARYTRSRARGWVRVGTVL